jgi:site-specific DNA recombinase
MTPTALALAPTPADLPAAFGTPSVGLSDLDILMAANRAAARAALTKHIEPTRAVIYGRSSADGEQTGVTTSKQEKDGRGLADARGIPVVGVYLDDDTSAYHDVARPEFERLLADAKKGLFDVVIVRHTDRLYRRLKVLTRIVEELTPYATVWAVYEGEIDLTTAAGIMMAQIKGAVAENESRVKGERVANHNLWRTENGVMATAWRPFGWAWAEPCDAVPRDQGGTCDHNLDKKPHAPGERPVRWSRGGLVPHPTEGPALARAFEMFADNGGNLLRVARWLDGQGFTGARGGPITGETVRQMFELPRHAGLAAAHGKILAEAKNGALVSRDLWQRVQLILEDPTRRKRGAAPATLLAGFLTCGRCEGRMTATKVHRPKRNGSAPPPLPVYKCKPNQHLYRPRAELEGHILTLVGNFVVDNAPTLAARAATDPGEAETKAMQEVATLRERLKGYHRLSAEMDPEDYAQATKDVRRKLAEAERATAVVAKRPHTARLTAAEDIKATWLDLLEGAAEDPTPLRDVLGELLADIVVNPRPRRSSAPALEVTWQEWVPVK